MNLLYHKAESGSASCVEATEAAPKIDTLRNSLRNSDLVSDFIRLLPHGSSGRDTCWVGLRKATCQEMQDG